MEMSQRATKMSSTVRGHSTENGKLCTNGIPAVERFLSMSPGTGSGASKPRIELTEFNVGCDLRSALNDRHVLKSKMEQENKQIRKLDNPHVDMDVTETVVESEYEDNISGDRSKILVEDVEKNLKKTRTLLINLLAMDQCRKEASCSRTERISVQEKARLEKEVNELTSYMKDREKVKNLEDDSFRFSQSITSLDNDDKTNYTELKENLLDLQNLRQRYRELLMKKQILMKQKEKTVGNDSVNTREENQLFLQRISEVSRLNNESLVKLEKEQKFLVSVLSELKRLIIKLDNKSKELLRCIRELERECQEVRYEIKRQHLVLKVLHFLQSNIDEEVTVPEVFQKKEAQNHNEQMIVEKEHCLQKLKNLSNSIHLVGKEIEEIDRSSDSKGKVVRCKQQIAKIRNNWEADKKIRFSNFQKDHQSSLSIREMLQKEMDSLNTHSQSVGETRKNIAEILEDLVTMVVMGCNAK